MKINFVSEFFPGEITRFTLIGIQFNEIPDTTEHKFIGFNYKMSINVWLLGFGLQILIKR